MEQHPYCRCEFEDFKESKIVRCDVCFALDGRTCLGGSHKRHETQSQGIATIENMRLVANEIISSLSVEDYLAKAMLKALKHQALMRKNASQLTTMWYEHILRFKRGKFPNILDGVYEFEEKFSGTFRTFLKTLKLAPDEDEKHVQKACGPLWDSLQKLFFDDPDCKVDEKSRHVATQFDDVLDESDNCEKKCIVKGIPDGSVLWLSEAIHIWELKRQDYNLNGNSASAYTACAQIAVYIKADIESMLKGYGYLTPTTMGILTNGSSWILVTAYSSLDNGNLRIRWTNTNPIHCSLDAQDNLVQVLNLILVACKNSMANLKELKNASFAQDLQRMNIGMVDNNGGGMGPENQHDREGTNRKDSGGGDQRGNGRVGNRRARGGGHQKESGASDDQKGSGKDGKRKGHGGGNQKVSGGQQGSVIAQCNGGGDQTTSVGNSGYKEGFLGGKTRDSERRQPLKSLPLTVQNIKKLSGKSDLDDVLQTYPILKTFLDRKMVFFVTAEELFES
mmetsp:Transcript_7681/g.10885  ORF Transcript_7681/g.10885 Transcript_7681/m.10885 type:complete len:507 (-) Transcript_7681:211-1731(-)